jgi:hypothetical protein
MVLLKRALLCWGFLLGAAAGAAADDFLSVWDFSGFVQGRGVGFFYNTAVPSGGLNDLGAGAGGEAGSQALFQRLEFSLNTRLPWAGWGIYTTAGADGYKTSFKDLYVKYAPEGDWGLKAGRFRVPFGLDPQSSSASMDTVERPLIYGFGNFGWVNPLGFNFVGERDYGVRFDWEPPPGFAGFSPLAQGGVVLGNGYDVASGAPTQFMLRVGFDNLLEFEDLKNQVTLGFSFSYGANHFVRRSETYLPIGSTGDLASRPDLSLQAVDLGNKGVVLVEGVDLTLRMNQVALKSEAVSRRVESYSSQGYYVTGVWELAEFGLPLDLVARWEEAIQGYADGTHLPNIWYQAVTSGFTWHLARAWKVQANYIVLVLDNQQHVFPGSDLGILQVQWNF